MSRKVKTRASGLQTRSYSVEVRGETPFLRPRSLKIERDASNVEDPGGSPGGGAIGEYRHSAGQSLQDLSESERNRHSPPFFKFSRSSAEQERRFAEPKAARAIRAGRTILMEGELDYRAKPVLKTESTSKRYGESALRLPPVTRLAWDEETLGALPRCPTISFASRITVVHESVKFDGVGATPTSRAFHGLER
jgi:hypothetical protein